MPAVAVSFSIAITWGGRVVGVGMGMGGGGWWWGGGVCDGELYLPACRGRINLGTTD